MKTRTKILSMMVLVLFTIAVLNPVKIVTGQMMPTESDAKKASVDPFLDLVGDINYTYHEDHSDYEGKTLSVSSSGDVESQNIKFAVTMNGLKGGYWLLPDGSVPDSTFDARAEFHGLYDFYNHDNKDTERSCIFGLCTEYVDISVSGDEFTQSSGNANQTVDNMSSDAPTDDDFDLNLYEMIGKNDSKILETDILTDLQSPASKYDDFETDLTDIDDDDTSLTEPETPNYRTKTHSTNNITETMYLFLAEYIEDVKGYEPRTVKIDHNTENVTSEVISSYLTNDAINNLRDIIDEELINEGLMTPQGSITTWVSNVRDRATDLVTGATNVVTGTSSADMLSGDEDKIGENDTKVQGTNFLEGVLDAAIGVSNNVASSFNSDKGDDWTQRSGEDADGLTTRSNNRFAVDTPMFMSGGIDRPEDITSNTLLWLLGGLIVAGIVFMVIKKRKMKGRRYS